MKTNGASGPPCAADHEDGSKMLTRIPPAASLATTIPVYQMPDTGVYGHEPPGRNRWIDILLRRKLTIAGVAVLGALAGVMITLASTPMYRASTSIQLDGYDDSFLRDLRQLPPMFPNGPPESYIRNQVKLLESETLALRVARKLGIKPKSSSTDPGPAAGKRWEVLWRKHQSPEQEIIDAVQRVMKVRATPQTQVVEVQYEATDAEGAALGANTVAAEFIALNQEARWQLAQDTSAWLSKQTADLKYKVESGNRALQDFARSSGLVFAGNHSTLAEDKIRQIQDALSKAETDRATKLARYEAAVSSDTESLPDLVVTGPLRQYQTDLQGLRRQLADLKAIYTPAYYKVAQLEAQAASLESAITKERLSLIERLRNEYDASVRLERALHDKNASDLREAQQINEKENRYDLLKHEADANQQLYESMLQKVKEAGMASAMRATNVHVMDPARAPESPYSPNLPMYSALGLALGGFGGVGLVLYREPASRVSTPGDATLLNIPLLGTIPSARDDRELAGAWPALSGKNPSNNLALVTWQQEGSLLSESFRTTLASILFCFPSVPAGQSGGASWWSPARNPARGKPLS